MLSWHIQIVSKLPCHLAPKRAIGVLIHLFGSKEVYSEITEKFGCLKLLVHLVHTFILSMVYHRGWTSSTQAGWWRSAGVVIPTQLPGISGAICYSKFSHSSDLGLVAVCAAQLSLPSSPLSVLPSWRGPQPLPTIYFFKKTIRLPYESKNILLL